MRRDVTARANWARAAVPVASIDPLPLVVPCPEKRKPRLPEATTHERDERCVRAGDLPKIGLDVSPMPIDIGRDGPPHRSTFSCGADESDRRLRDTGIRQIIATEELAAVDLPLEGEDRLQILFVGWKSRRVSAETDGEQDCVDFLPQMFDSPAPRTFEPRIDQLRRPGPAHYAAHEERSLISDVSAI